LTETFLSPSGSTQSVYSTTVLSGIFRISEV